jgi:HSP20 family protein
MPDEKKKNRHTPLTFHPVKNMEEMGRRIDDRILQPALHAVWQRIPESIKAWSPAVDIYTRDENIIVRVELAGMKLEDIDVQVSYASLTIKGERKPAVEIKENEFDRKEIAYGAIFRNIGLPYKIDPKSTDAVYEDGILTITLQKASRPKIQRVPVKIRKKQE